MVMSTRINSVLDALMSALIAVDIDTTWRFLTEYWVVVMDTTATQEKYPERKQSKTDDNTVARKQADARFIIER